MCSSKGLLIVTIAVVVLLVHPNCAQSPVEPFIDVLAAAIKSATLPRNDIDDPVELGREVSIGEVPYQIALYRYNYFICGGAIISADWILTAADCVYGGGSFGIRAGSSSNAEGGQIRHVTAVVINGDYNSISKENNIAMVCVSKPLVWTRFVRPVAIAGQRSKVPDNLLLTGWGSTDNNIADNEFQLRGVQAIYISYETCRNAYLNTASISKNVLCATVSINDACQTDSGSPLTSQGTLYGIQSLGAGCARDDIPGIYTNVRYQRRWIKAVIKRFRGKIAPKFKIM